MCGQRVVEQTVRLPPGFALPVKTCTEVNLLRMVAKEACSQRSMHADTTEVIREPTRCSRAS